MNNNQDARPFVHLKKDAEEFRTKFDEDIAECMNFLDAKITALICDPDSLGSKCIRPNAAAEFSRAKYDIFISVKKLFLQKEKEWTNYISEMKKLFLDNVEIFLAGTKLEVKLPSSEFESTLGPRKSPGNRKSSVASSFMASLTKNIPGLSAANQSQQSSSTFLEGTSNVEEKTQFSRRGRYASKLPPFSTSIPSYRKDSSSASSEDEALGEKGASEIAMDIVPDHTLLKSSSQTRNSISSDLNTSRSSSRHRNSLNKNDLNALANYTSNSDENAVAEEAELNNVPVPSKGRKGRQTAKNQVHNSLANEYTSNSDENAVAEETQMDEGPVSSKGRRGRQAAKKRIDNSAANENYTSNSDENAMAEETNKMEEVPVSSKGRKGRRAAKEKIDNSAANENYTTNSDENVVADETPIAEVPVSFKGRRGRQAAKKKVDNSAANENCMSNSDENAVVEEAEINEIPVSSRGRKGRQTSKTKTDNTADKSVVTKASARGRRGAKAVVEEVTSEEDKSVVTKASARGRRGAKAVVEEETSEEDIIPDPVPAKSASRRKTLFPNARNVIESDIVPGISVTNKSKRKTMSAVSEFEAAAPSKRLKISSQKDIYSQEKDNAVNDNLLESDENYSDWMPLKSIDGKIPTRPAIYELKVWRAKKSAFIGECESLRQKLTLYKLRQNSGHKHLDKFIDRNYNDIQVRFEVVDSMSNTKEEVKNRIKTFVSQHKTTPAYN